MLGIIRASHVLSSTIFPLFLFGLLAILSCKVGLAAYRWQNIGSVYTQNYALGMPRNVYKYVMFCTCNICGLATGVPRQIQKKDVLTA